MAAGAALAGLAAPRVHAAENNTIRLALIGCGGRGSGAVGKKIMGYRGGNVKSLIMELGGKSAALVCADADVDLAVNALPTNQISLRLGYPPPFNAAAVNWLQHTVFLDQTVELIRTMFPLATTEQLTDIRDQ